MSADGVVLGVMLSLIVGGVVLFVAYAMLVPRLRAMIDIATRQATAVSKQQDRITFLEACLDNTGGEATPEELGL